MDPVSQAVVGALAAGLASPRDRLRRALAVGALSAMSADLDVMIGSPEDPLLGLMFHRHFTHSLVFIPVGALLCAWILSFLVRARWRELYRPAFWGYATAAPLDALTSYGTHLFWPFTDARTAWNCIAIVDPVYTLTLLVLVITAAVGRKKQLLAWAAVFALAWHGFGFVQRERAEFALERHASENGYSVRRYWAQPSIGNLIVWRGLIETDRDIHVFGIRTGSDVRLRRAGTYVRYRSEDNPDITAGSVLATDVERFTRFSSGFVSRLDLDGGVLTDARYSPAPWGMEPLWALELQTREPDRHARLRYYREPKSLRLELLWASIRGAGWFSPENPKKVSIY